MICWMMKSGNVLLPHTASITPRNCIKRFCKEAELLSKYLSSYGYTCVKVRVIEVKP